MPRLLTTSASAVRRLRAKAVLMSVDVEAEELRESQVSALADLPRKWHIPPAFSVEFIAYVIDRERRIAQLREEVRCQYPFTFIQVAHRKPFAISLDDHYERRITRTG